MLQRSPHAGVLEVSEVSEVSEVHFGGVNILFAEKECL